jgi:hypothetical protein
MNLEATVLIHRTPEEVWTYLGDISNVSKWDRGVARVRQTSPNPSGVGLEFDTLATQDGRTTGKIGGKCPTESPRQTPSVALRCS